MISETAWPLHMPALLPKADFVDIIDDDADKPRARVPWERVMSVCGAHLRRQEGLPPRWATSGYLPTRDELVKLGVP